MQSPVFNTGTVRVERNEFRLTFNAPFVQNAGATGSPVGICLVSREAAFSSWAEH
jgi:hypothetical protein